MWYVGEGIGIGVVLGFDVCVGIDVGGCVEMFGDVGKCYFFCE